MDDASTKILHEELALLKERVRKIEKKLFPAAIPDDAVPLAASTISPPPLPEFPLQYAPPEVAAPQPKSGNLLGFIGVGCFVLAMLLLIKFSIDSGWLTPIRQMVLASLFGFVLIGVPLVTDKKDLPYLSMLPAGGVVVLHMVVYGAVFYHEILHPSWGILAVSLIGALSLMLLKTYKENTYAVISIAGTYLGAMVLNNGFMQDYQFALFVILWATIFCSAATQLQNRALITLSAYFSLMSVAILPMYSEDRALLIQVTVIQLVQIVIYSVSIARYSLLNKTPLTWTETIQLLPVYLFFYGHLYYVIDILSPAYAIAFSIVFALGIMGLALFAEKRSEVPLESKEIIFTYVAILLAHSVFLLWMSTIVKYSFVAALLVALALAPVSNKTGDTTYRGVKAVLGIIIGLALLFVLVEEAGLNRMLYPLFGTIYGLALVTVSVKHAAPEKKYISFLFSVAHIQVLVAISRLLDLFSLGWPEAPIGVLYASLIMFLGFKKNSRQIAKSSFLPLGGSLLGFLANDFALFGTGQRIVSLMIMGALIYVGGYFYRKIDG